MDQPLAPIPPPDDSPTPLEVYYAQVYRKLGERAVLETLEKRDDLTLDEARQKALEIALMMRRHAEETAAFLQSDTWPDKHKGTP